MLKRPLTKPNDGKEEPPKKHQALHDTQSVDAKKLPANHTTFFSWPPDEEEYYCKPIGLLSWDVDGVLVNYAESKKMETSHAPGKYVFINKERVIKILKKAVHNGIRNICLTSRSTEEDPKYWLSTPKILEQYESKRHELFDSIRYTNKKLKSKPLMKIIEGDFDLDDVLHIDDNNQQADDCAKAGINIIQIKTGTDAEFDEIDKFVDDLIARKKKLVKKTS